MRRALSLGVLLASCAHAPEEVDLSEAPPAQVRERPAPEDPKLVARDARTALECEQKARALVEQGAPKDGWALLEACIARSDFDDVHPLLVAPWLPVLKAAGADGVRIVARVIARVPGDPTVDLTLCGDQGLPLRALPPGRPAQRELQSRWVLVRGVIPPDAPRDGSVRVAELTYGLRKGYIRQTRYGYIERSWGVKQTHAWQESGRELIATSGAGACKAPPEVPHVFLFRVSGLESEGEGFEATPLGQLEDDGPAAVRVLGTLHACFPVRER